MDHRINSSISGVVEIHSVVVADVGWYNCTARNNHSHTSSSSVYVSVMSKLSNSFCVYILNLHLAFNFLYVRSLFAYCKSLLTLI